MSKHLSLVAIASLLVGMGALLSYFMIDDDTSHSAPIKINTTNITHTTTPTLATASHQQRITLHHPMASLDDKQELVATLHIEHEAKNSRQIGQLTISGKPWLDASSNRFYLQNPNINEIRLTAVDAPLQAAIHQAVSQYFKKYAVYAPFENSQVLQQQHLIYQW